MLRIRILRVRLYPGYSYRRIPLGAGACARGKGGKRDRREEAHGKRGERERRGTRREGEAHREELIGRSTENAHEKHA